jgi:glycosyltransferase involved in cell wall biosynthesis
MPSIICCVTTDLHYDQRMFKICTSLQNAGYSVTLVGRKGGNPPTNTLPVYQQHWLGIWTKKGPFFYLEFQLRLFFYLIFHPADIYSGADLDTLPAVYLASIVRQKKRCYDAHELFTEQKEVISRPRIHRIWKLIESWLVPQFTKGYTVNQSLVTQFANRYGVQYEVIRNIPHYKNLPTEVEKDSPRWIIYQGAVNEGRCFEQLIPAMQQVNAPLRIYGAGNFFSQVQELIQVNDVTDRVHCEGLLVPELLWKRTPQASIGITLFENRGLNQYLSLANRFFDYIMAGVPQICPAFPEYEAILEKYPVGLAVDTSDPDAIAAALNKLLNDSVVYDNCVQACLQAREVFTWEEEQKKLLVFYANC